MIPWLITLASIVFYVFMWMRTARRFADRAWKNHERNYHTLEPEDYKGEFIAVGLFNGFFWPFTLPYAALADRDGFWFPEQSRKAQRAQKAAEFRRSAEQMMQDGVAAKLEGNDAVAQANFNTATALKDIARDLESADS